MTAKKNNSFISTYARTILSEWKTLSELIAKHTTLVKKIAAGEETEKQFALLSEQQIHDALEGPYRNFFKQKMLAYAAILRIQVELTIGKEDLLKSEHRIITDESKVPDYILSKTSLDDLENMSNELDQRTTEHNQQWEEHLEQWNTHLIEN